MDAFRGGEEALRADLRRHPHAPERELYVLPTDREEPEIAERARLGLRTAS